MFTSRSAVEAYQDCQRYRYNQYHLLGKGVVPKYNSIPLVTGSAVHRGIEHLMNRVRIGQEPDVEIAVQLATEQYTNDCDKAGFKYRGKGTLTDAQNEYTYLEQRALVEGLVRAWHLRELPWIVAGYRVLAVERDIIPIEIAPGVMFQAKVDAELQQIESNDYYNYSLKTARMWNEKSESSYGHDLQGLTEIWAVEQDAMRRENKRVNALENVKELLANEQFGNKNLAAIQGYLEKQNYSRKVMGTKFCVLIKGARKESDYGSGADGERLFITYSPLIRGYKHFTPDKVEYAHSWRYPNSENKSGYGILGKGWEPFNVWEMDGGVKRWIGMLDRGEIQPECGDIIKAQVVTPVEMFRKEEEITEAIKEISYQEERLLHGLEVMNLDCYFPHNRKHCDWHFGEPCEYKALCWDKGISGDPFGSGLYQIREPHHAAERLAK